MHETDLSSNGGLSPRRNITSRKLLPGVLLWMRNLTLLLKTRPDWLPDAISAVILIALLAYLIYYVFFKESNGR